MDDIWSPYTASAIRERLLEQDVRREAVALADWTIQKKLNGVISLGYYMIHGTPMGHASDSRLCRYYREAAMDRLIELGMVDVDMVLVPRMGEEPRTCIQFTIPEADE